MRLAKTDTIAGLDAATARNLMRVLGNPGNVEVIHARIPDGADAAGAAAELMELGFLRKVDGRPYEDEDWWVTTTKGNALAMASFAKPISRLTADCLLAGLLDRARNWNANPERMVSIDEVVVFGSYLDPTVERLGDVDIAVSLSDWPEGDAARETFARRVQAYARASGRTFSSFLEELFWPKKEAIQHLKNRSTALNITTENVRDLTEVLRVVYTRESSQKG